MLYLHLEKHHNVEHGTRCFLGTTLALGIAWNVQFFSCCGKQHAHLTCAQIPCVSWPHKVDLEYRFECWLLFHFLYFIITIWFIHNNVCTTMHAQCLEWTERHCECFISALANSSFPFFLLFLLVQRVLPNRFWLLALVCIVGFHWLDSVPHCIFFYLPQVNMWVGSAAVSPVVNFCPRQTVFRGAIGGFLHLFISSPLT